MIAQLPLIFQISFLPELAPGLSSPNWLLRFHRAGPSTSLDKSCLGLIKLLSRIVPCSF